MADLNKMSDDELIETLEVLSGIKLQIYSNLMKKQKCFIKIKEKCKLLLMN